MSLRKLFNSLTERVFVAEAESMGLKCENVNLQSQLDSAHEKIISLQIQFLNLDLDFNSMFNIGQDN